MHSLRWHAGGALGYLPGHRVTTPVKGCAAVAGAACGSEQTAHVSTPAPTGTGVEDWTGQVGLT